VDVVISPQTVNLSTQFGAPVPALTPGEVVEAQVLQILAEGRARLAVAGALIDVETLIPLTAGTTVRLAVKNTPEGIRLTLLDPSAMRAAGAAATQASVIRPTAGNDVARPSVILSGAASPAAQPASPAPASVGGTSGANTTLTAGSVPASLIEAQSGVAPGPEVAGAAAVSTAVRGAALRQNSLAPLFADLAVAVRSPALPEAVREVAAQVLAQRVSVGNGLSATALKQGFQSSGLFLESRLAADDAVVGPANDLKAALGLLRQVLKLWLDAEPAAKGLGKTPLADLPTSPPLAPSHGGNAAVLPPSARMQPAAPPPYRGAPTVAQPELPPLLSPGMAPEEAARVLLRETDGAIARQTLLQAASLPDPAAQHTDPSGPRWHFEIPFATAHGTALAQFEIARDGKAAPQESVSPAWRARFSIDVEPIGAVHAQVALLGERAAVTLWAERPDSAARLRDNASALTEALRDAALEPDILVRDGAPPRARQTTAAAGRFLDRAT
jgi:hypothetical protein